MPLMWAAAEGHSQVVETLIEAGAEFRTSLPSGFSPLMFAAREGRIEVVRVLLRHGADVHQVMKRDKASGKAPRKGTSPLILAVENGYFALAKVLLAAGADPKLWTRANKYGWTPMDIAAGYRPGNFKPSEAMQSALQRQLERR